ncbi:hypothetical protein KKF32_00250 [Patescibacteria group bacterium]|nr:hypothetical protein [Patescibacteria group bacterium]
MEPQIQNLQDEQQNQSKSNSVLAIVITVIITLVISGGGVYAWQYFIDQDKDLEIQYLEQQVNSLMAQVNKLQQAQSDEEEQESEKNDSVTNWQTYENTKYNYSFNYPVDCLDGPLPGYCKQSPPAERPEECLCFLNRTDSDYVIMQTYTGARNELNLATFSVTHRSTDAYNLPANTDLLTWLKEKFVGFTFPDNFNAELDGKAAVKVYTPESQGVFSGEIIFFLKGDKIFMIDMIDVDNQSNKVFYDTILDSFSF